MTVHNLKPHTEYEVDLLSGAKRCEVRKNDSDYRTGDTLLLKMDRPFRMVAFLVTHVLSHEDFPDGIAPGYVVLSVEREAQPEEIKPCPFCGGVAYVDETWNCKQVVGCLDCQSSTGSWVMESSAIAAWNRRAGEGKE